MPTHVYKVKQAARGPGRPRSEKARKAVLDSTLYLLKRSGFNELRIESIAERAKVGKATIYRSWPTKADLVVAAFVSSVEEELRFPQIKPVQAALRQQMERWVHIFRSPLGQIIATVIGAGQSEPEILQAFQTHWVEPRRREARLLLQEAMEEGQVRSDLDPDTILDMFYGPLYLRLLVRNAPLSTQLVNTIFDVLTPGLGIRPSR
jgi:AcrR family transcriptional regulator